MSGSQYSCPFKAGKSVLIYSILGLSWRRSPAEKHTNGADCPQRSYTVALNGDAGMTDELRKLIAEEKARDAARQSAEERSRAKQQALAEKRQQIEGKWRMDTETGGWAQAIRDINASLAEVEVELQAHGQYPQTSPLVLQLIVTVDKRDRQVGTLVCDPS